MTKKTNTEKPLAIEQEAKAFTKQKATTRKLPETNSSKEILPSQKDLMAATVLAGLLSQGSQHRALELVEEAYRYVDLILQHNK